MAPLWDVVFKDIKVVINQEMGEKVYYIYSMYDIFMMQPPFHPLTVWFTHFYLNFKHDYVVVVFFFYYQSYLLQLF